MTDIMPLAWRGTNHQAVNAEVARRCNLRQSTVERVLREHQSILGEIAVVAEARNRRREQWEFEITGVVENPNPRTVQRAVDKEGPR